MAKAKRPFVEFFLQFINFIFTLCGLSILGYGLLSLLKWNQAPNDHVHNQANTKYVIARRLLLSLDSSHPLLVNLPKNWFIYLLIGIGATLFIISCFGYVGTASRSSCCLLSYCIFLVALVLVETGVAAIIFFDHDWEQVMPADKSGTFKSIYHFMNVNWKIIRWVALVVLVLEVVALVLALYLRSVVNRTRYDSDEESIAYSRVQQLPPIPRRRVRTTTMTPSTSGKEQTKPGVKWAATAGSTPSNSVREQIRSTDNKLYRG